jgi:trimethylamine--corrinoid protein Co-methyltransferase
MPTKRTTNPDVISLSSAWTPQLTLAGQDRLEQLHAAAVCILEQTGLNVHHPAMRLRLAAAGARMGDEPRVYLTRELVERALGTARHDVVIHNRLGEPAMSLLPHEIHFGTGSDLLYALDVRTTHRRDATLEDVAQAARVCDALAEVDFVMSHSLPAELRDGEPEPQQYYALLSNTTKPPIMTSFSGLESLERVHEMACLVAGSDAAFRECPNYILYGQFVSPLQHDRNAIERLIFCADHEVPLIYIPTIIAGASGPITLAGALALAVAESLAGLVMHQTQRAGAPFIFGACVSPLDMRTMLFPYGSPEWRLNDLLMAEMARFYRLPVFGTGGATDSKLVDAQAGLEYANSLLVAALAGTNLIHDVGYLDAGLTGSLESIVLGAEQIRWVKRFMAGLAVSAETLALDVVQAAGPGGDFLSRDHTLQHLRQDMWLPLDLDHMNFHGWAEAGSRDYGTRARERARQLVQSHRPATLDSKVDERLREICGLAA